MNEPAVPQSTAAGTPQPSWEKPPSEVQAYELPERDRRDIITQHAFRVAPKLLGLPLASPWRRGAAAGIDGLLIVIMSRTGGVLLASVLAVFAYGWVKSRYRPASRLGRGLLTPARLMLSLMIFAFAVSVLQPLWDYATGEELEDRAAGDEGVNLSGAQGIAYGVHMASMLACDDAACRREAAAEMAQGLAQSELPAADRRKLYRSAVDAAADSDAEKAQLLQAAAFADEAAPATAPLPIPAAGSGAPARPEPPVRAAQTDDADDAEDDPRDYSLLKLLGALLDDLGLSFGWGAVYFTLFTTFWAGQTPGKRLLHIRVVHLSGQPLSYWASFGRYGGYAAGVATGLLGFLQVFWDANRQAVQDQLSFTAVIRDDGSQRGADA